MASDTVQTQFDLIARDRASRVFDRVGKSVNNMESRSARLSRTLGRVAKVAAIGLAGGLAAASIGARRAIEDASDLNETMSKVSVIFGKAGTKALNTWGDTAATRLGQSKRQALDAAATFGIFGKSAGLTGRELATFSSDFAGLASDLASFNNTTPEEAITAIGAALRGESEPIRRYGVLLDDATLRQEALRLGLIKTTKEALTPQQKVLAAQAQIYKQTKDAQGDFARTSGGLANQQRILKAQLEDVSAEIGQKLLPFAVKVVTWLNERLPGAIGFVETAVDKVKGVIDRVAGAVEVAVPRVQEAFKKFVPKAQELINNVKQRLVEIGGPLIAAISQGMATGDWSGLGKTIGEGLAKTIRGAFKAGDALLGAIRSVDWLAVGKQASAIAVPFIIGFTNDLILNFGRFMKEHPMDAAVFVASLIPVGRVAGLLHKVIGKLPIIGPMLNLLSKAGKATEGAAMGIVRGIGRALSFLAPQAVARLATMQSRIVYKLFSIAIDAGAAAVRIGRSILDKIMAPLAGLGDRLGGLATRAVGMLLAPFRGAIGSLAGIGRSTIDGFIRGLTSGFRVVQEKLNWLTSKIPDWKGPKAKDKKLLEPTGITIIDGLVKGLELGSKKVKEVLNKLTEDTKSRLKGLRDSARGILSSVGDSVKGIVDVSAFGAPVVIGQDAEGNDITRTPSVAETAGGFASQARAFVEALRAMAAKKLAPSLIAAVAAAGPAGGLQAAQAFAAASDQDIASVNASIGEINSLAQQAGNTVLKTTPLPAQIKREEAMLKLLGDVVAELRNAKANDEVALRITKGGDLIVEYVNQQNRRAERRR